MNEMELDELENGDLYKYLGQDENVGYNNVLNKEKVTKEFFGRIRKIWSSEQQQQSDCSTRLLFQ